MDNVLDRAKPALRYLLKKQAEREDFVDKMLWWTSVVMGAIFLTTMMLLAIVGIRG